MTPETEIKLLREQIRVADVAFQGLHEQYLKKEDDLFRAQMRAEQWKATTLTMVVVLGSIVLLGLVLSLLKLAD